MPSNKSLSANGHTTNGDGRFRDLDPITLNQINDQITNATTQILRSMRGTGFDSRRSINDECGYPQDFTIEQYWDLYDQEPIAARVVECFPEECWKVTPEVYEDEDTETETDFEIAWTELNRKLSQDKPPDNTKDYGWHEGETNEGSAVWEALERLDKLSGIGSYGVIVLGIADGKPLNEPAAPRKEQDLAYISVFPQMMAQVSTVESDQKNPRYGRPTMYNVTLTDQREPSQGLSGGPGTVMVHHSRVIHVPSSLRSNEVFGVPRTHPVRHRLWDLMKLYGGSAEMYWRGAFPGLALVQQMAGIGTDFPSDIKDHIENWSNGLQRYLAIAGVDPKMLGPTVVDPGPQIDKQLEAVSIKIGIPKRILMGSERGELSSNQDSIGWNAKVKGRHNSWCSPKIVIPLINRLIWLGVLPTPEKFTVHWPDVTVTTEKERADIAKVAVDTHSAYIAGNVQSLIPPNEYLTNIMGLSQEEAAATLEASAQQQEEQIEVEREKEVDQLEHESELRDEGLLPPRPDEMVEEGQAPVAPAKEEPKAPTKESAIPSKTPPKPKPPKRKPPTDNTFCPNGPGGGKDPTCGSEKTIDWEDSHSLQEKLESSGKKYVFHGTSETANAEIMKEGLKGGKGKGASVSDEGAYKSQVAMTTSLWEARSYAVRAAEKTGSKPMVLAVELDSSTKKLFKKGGTKTTLLVKGELPTNLLGVVTSKGVSKPPTKNSKRWIKVNTYCPNGPGGGKDPTCSPKGTSGAPIDRLNDMYNNFKNYSYGEIRSNVEGIAKSVKGEKFKQLIKDFGIVGVYSKKQGFEEIMRKIEERKGTHDRLAKIGGPKA